MVKIKGKEGVEVLFTYVNANTGALIAILADGTKYGRNIHTSGWKHLTTKKADITLEQWTANKRALYDAMPAWAKGVKALPSLRTLEKWSNDGVARTVDGQRIEPDGTASNGAPSWLLVVGVI